MGYVLCLSALADRYSDVCASVSLVCDLALSKIPAIVIIQLILLPKTTAVNA